MGEREFSGESNQNLSNIEVIFPFFPLWRVEDSIYRVHKIEQDIKFHLKLILTRYHKAFRFFSNIYCFSTSRKSHLQPPIKILDEKGPIFFLKSDVVFHSEHDGDFKKGQRFFKNRLVLWQNWTTRVLVLPVDDYSRGKFSNRHQKIIYLQRLLSE